MRLPNWITFSHSCSYCQIMAFRTPFPYFNPINLSPKTSCSKIVWVKSRFGGVGGGGGTNDIARVSYSYHCFHHSSFFPPPNINPSSLFFPSILHPLLNPHPPLPTVHHHFSNIFLNPSVRLIICH